jgi:hypothetical protein
MAQKWHLKEGTTWRKKLAQPHPNHGKVVAVPPRMQKRFGKGTMVIPRPLDVDAAMRRARKGKLITQAQIRAIVARAAGVDHACPMTTGMFVRIAAEAAEEDRRAGKKRITPYWRTITDDGRLIPKFPGGVAAQARALRGEGFSIERSSSSRPPRVKDFEQYLAKP